MEPYFDHMTSHDFLYTPIMYGGVCLLYDVATSNSALCIAVRRPLAIKQTLHYESLASEELIWNVINSLRCISPE